MLDENSLLAAGYRKFNSRGERHSTHILQRRVDDDNGRRYFITVYVYDNADLKARYPDASVDDFGFMPCVQFQPSDDEPCVDVVIHRTKSMTVASMEALVEKMWIAAGSPYYQRYDDDT